jgi:hypothetical protein
MKNEVIEGRYCKWMHIENGNTIVRRVHRIEVQGKDGRLYVLEDDGLPDTVVMNTGVGYRGKHLAQVLLDPKPTLGRERVQPGDNPWPNGRDALHVSAGFMGLLVIRALAYGVSAFASGLHEAVLRTTSW